MSASDDGDSGSTESDQLGLGQFTQFSLASRAERVVLDAILSGDFGAKLPSEEELARMMRVSRTTVRSALQNLERDGLITRRRSRGSTVNRDVIPNVLALQRVVGFDWLLRERGFEVDVVVRSSQVTSPPAIFSNAFSIAESSVWWLLTKRYSANGAVAIALNDLVMGTSLNGSSLPDPIPPSLFQLSASHFRDQIDHALVEISPQIAGSGGPGDTLLGLESGTAFTRLLEVHYSSRHDPLAYSAIDIDPNKVPVGFVRTR